MIGLRPLLPILEDRAIVREFFGALADPQTYNLRRNGYVFFGVLWGLPVPLVTIGLDLYARHLSPTPREILAIVLDHPIHIVFLLHPLLFAVLFGAMGTVRYRKEQAIGGLLDNLRAKLAETELLNAQLREADKVKDEFLGTISHELKTPMVTLRGYGEMLHGARAGQLDDRQRRIVGIMLKNVDRELHLIDDLLNYIRLGAHPDDRERRAFDLGEVICRARDVFRPSLAEKKLNLETILPNSPLLVYAHRRNVEIVLNNLLSNAIKFTGEGGRIRVESRRGPSGRIQTTCSDTGCGIPEESIAHIFERFRQADGSTRRKHAGTGLGLAIVKKVLDSYDCSVEVESREGEGTTFRFDLPAAPAESLPAAAVGEGRNEHGR